MARPMATRWRLGPALEQVLDLQDLRGAIDRRLDLGLAHAGQLQAEGHVLGHRHVRIERVALEHHRNAALGRRHLVDQLASDVQLAGGDLLQTGDAAQHGRLAAARGPDEDHELAVADLQVDARDDGQVAERFLQRLQQDIGHRGCRLENRCLAGRGPAPWSGPAARSGVDQNQVSTWKPTAVALDFVSPRVAL